MQKSIISILLFITIFHFQQLQSQVPAEEPKTVLYRTEHFWGINIHTAGWGFSYRYGKHVTGTIKRGYDIEFVTMSSPKEYHINNQNYDNSKQYVYGKLNSFFIVRTGIGRQKLLFYKPERKGVEVKYFSYFGISHGILKPIYLEIINILPSLNQVSLSVEKYDPLKHFPENIYGRASFTEGLNQISYLPGLYLKGGLNFDFADYDENERIRMLEIGAILDAFPKNVPIMALTNNDKFFLNLYIAFHFGKKNP